MSDWRGLLGLSHAAMGCYELTETVCAGMGRELMPLDEGIMDSWVCGTAMDDFVEMANYPLVAEPDAQPGDVVLLGHPASGTVTGIAPVVERGLVLLTSPGHYAHPAPMDRIRPMIVSIRRLPEVGCG